MSSSAPPKLSAILTTTRSTLDHVLGHPLGRPTGEMFGGPMDGLTVTLLVIGHSYAAHDPEPKRKGIRYIYNIRTKDGIPVKNGRGHYWYDYVGEECTTTAG